MMPVARDNRWMDRADDARSGSSMGNQRRRHLSLVEPERRVGAPDAEFDIDS